MRSKDKGNDFERAICKELSLWWTGQERDDVFYRTSNSGGRATVRAKKGQSTFNHYGDVSASDPIGEPFLKLFRLELKRGYNHLSIQDLLDTKNDGGFAKWIAQAKESATQGGSLSWMLILRRDQRQAMCLFPYAARLSLRQYGAFESKASTLSFIDFTAPSLSGCLTCMRLQDFLSSVSPSQITSVVRSHE